MSHKKIFIIFIVAILCGAITSAYFFFPSTATHVLTGTAAVVVRSWGDTFGGQSGGIAAEINNGSPSSSAEEDGPAQGQNQNDPVTDLDTPAPMQSSATTSPVVILEADTSTVLTAPTDNEIAPDSTSSPSSSLPVAQCTISTSASLSRKLIFNEVAWMGSVPLAGEAGTSASNREWMELKNISGGPLDVSGWQVLDAAGNIKIVFDNATNVATGGFLLLARGADAVPGMTADKVYTGALTNAGGLFAIVDAACGASDILDASSGWPAGNNTTKQTLERDADGMGWHTSAVPGGTPKAENSMPSAPVANPTSTASTTGASTPTATSIVSGGGAAITISPVVITTTTTASTTADPACPPPLDHVVIAAVQVGSASSSANDFVKIFNPTASLVNMSGWRLRKKSSSGTDSSLRVFPDGEMVAAGSSFLWANSTDGFGDATNANVTSTATLAADNSVALLDASGTIIDSVAWGEGIDQYVETISYPTDPTAGQVLLRRSVGGAIVDTNNNSNDFAL